MTSAHPLSGVTVPLVTVLDERGMPTASAATRLLEAMASSGVRTLMLLGSNGEGALLPPKLTQPYLVDIVAMWRELRPQGAVVVNVSAPGTTEMLERADAALSAAPDLVMTSPPSYFRHRSDEIEAHVRALAAIGHPFAIYNVPAYSNPLPPEVFEALLGEPRLVGVKDSSGDPGVLARFVEIAAAREDIAVTQGDERALVDGLRAGAAGIVPGLANLAPALSVALYDAFRAGYEAVAQTAQDALTRLTSIHGVRRGVPAVKGILRDRGVIPHDTCAPPLASVTASELALLRDVVAPFDAEVLTA